DQAQGTRDQPAQIIQNAIKSRHASATPNLDDINIPDSLCSTLSGENFLIRDSIIEKERILLFTTKANIQHLSNSLYWMMDGTFKTVPTIFHQLYTIHAPVGTGDNSRVLPLVYVLMTKKSEFLYRALFQDLIEFAKENNILLSPTAILTDFELAAINASRIEFPNINNKCCFFHLRQSGWRKIQENKLSTHYGLDEDFSIKLRQLFALVFLPSNIIPAAFDALKEEMPTKTKEVVKWFEENYIHGKQIRKCVMVILAVHHPFFCHKCGPCMTPWKQEFQKEQQKVEHQVEAIIHSAQRQTPKKGTIEREQ
ncbi:11310_t:CDS:2, partial [Dentiscutata heterogama]